MKGVLSAKSFITAAFATSLLAVSSIALSDQALATPLPVKSVEMAKPVHTHDATISGLINLNKADVQTLAQLNGIGEKKAQAIIAYREAKGGFKTVDELVNVKGIGEKTLEKNRTLLSVN